LCTLLSRLRDRDAVSVYPVQRADRGSRQRHRRAAQRELQAAITSCVCVPGQTQRCTPTGGTTLSGYQDCSTNGAQWGTCVAPTIAIAPTSAPALEGATAETP
jgi:hypothetical protein